MNTIPIVSKYQSGVISTHFDTSSFCDAFFKTVTDRNLATTIFIMAGQQFQQPSDFKPHKEQYEFEDPARSWVNLVEATHLPDFAQRKQAVQTMIFEAKNSHWSHQLLDAELEHDVDYTGADVEDDMPPPNPGGDYTSLEELYKAAQQEDADGVPVDLDEDEDLTQPFGDTDFRTKVTARCSFFYQCPRCSSIFGTAHALQEHQRATGH